MVHEMQFSSISKLLPPKAAELFERLCKQVWVTTLALWAAAPPSLA
jgi:hypothetical protein